MSPSSIVVTFRKVINIGDKRNMIIVLQQTSFLSLNGSELGRYFHFQDKSSVNIHLEGPQFQRNIDPSVKFPSYNKSKVIDCKQNRK
jgi:hypothetical protein